MSIPLEAARVKPHPSLRLHEEDVGAFDSNLLGALTDDECAAVCAASTVRVYRAGEMVFQQGAPHDGIFIVLSGQVRTFYLGPSGREITLAYWSPGNFVGGPELFGGTPHVWSGQAMSNSQALHVPGPRRDRRCGPERRRP